MSEKKSDEIKIEPFDFVVLRSPLLPVEAGQKLRGVIKSYQSWQAGDGALEKILAEDREAIKQELLSSFKNPVIAEALFLASPELYKAAQKLLDGAMIEDSKQQDKTTASLYKYFGRMSSRCTPFGLFAGLNLGELANKTEVVFRRQELNYRDIHIDMAWIGAFAEKLAKKSELKEVLTWYPNSSWYVVRDKVRYVESRPKDKIRTHHLVSVDDSSFLQAVLERAKPGATVLELAQSITGPEISIDDARGFVDDLIENQLLISEFEPTTTGDDFLDVLCSKMERIAHESEEYKSLAKIISKLKELRETQLGVGVDIYDKLAAELKVLEDNVPDNNLLRVDMLKSAQTAQLNRNVFDELSRAIKFSLKVTTRGAGSHLSEFAQAFLKRYEAREVPLVEALDTELGLGYMQRAREGGVVPLLDGLAFGGGSETSSISWTQSASLAFRKMYEALNLGLEEVVIDDKDLDEFGGNHRGTVQSGGYSTMIAVYADSTEKLDRGDFLLDYSGFSSSPARLLGRFCLADKALSAKVVEISRCEAEYHPNAIYAEIAHLPQNRIGNILLRPNLSDYEIPYLAQSSVEREFQIPVSDLYVSVEQSRVILRSRKLNKEIKPRLTCAHNYYAGLPIYHFLCDMQEQDSFSGAGWSWGVCDAAPRLPRVRYGKVILAPARWKLESTWFEKLSKLQDAKLFDEFQTKRKEQKMPRYVLLKENDNELPIDLDNILALRILVDRGKRGYGTTLVEDLAALHGVFLKGPEGSFTNEIVVPFKLLAETATEAKEAAQERVAKKTITEGSQIRRTFLPGSEWLYSKIYLGHKTADVVLKEVIAPFANNLTTQGIIDKWFFIRYADPEFHLRVRFHVKQADSVGGVMRSLEEAIDPFVRSNLVATMQYDTYVRELERYGAEAIEAAESLFHADSIAVSEIVSRLIGDSGQAMKWPITLFGMDQMLGDLGFREIEKKHQVLTPILASFAAENNFNKGLRVQLDTKYRKEKALVESLFNSDKSKNLALNPFLDVIRMRSKALEVVCDRLHKDVAKLDIPLAQLAGSYIHMFVNRICSSQGRRQEFVLWYFLESYYKSQLARAKKNISAN